MQINHDEHKLLQPSKPINNLQVDAPLNSIPDSSIADPNEIEAQMQEWEAQGPRRSGRMSMSPIMTQILRQ